MAFKGLKRANVSATAVQEMNESLRKQSLARSVSKLTEDGIENGIKIFSVKDYENDKALVYIPEMPVLEVDGKRVKWHAPVFTHQMKKLGDGSDRNFAGALRSTLGLDSAFSSEVLAELGISGKAEKLQELISKGWDYKNARDMLDLARLHHASSPEDISDEDWKAIRKNNFKYLPIENAVKSYWFPIFVVATVKDKDGKHTNKPEGREKLDADGNVIMKDGKPVLEPFGELMWYKASEKTFTERLKKSAEALMLEDDETYEGNLFLFDYRIEEKENAGQSQFTSTLMRSANSLTISVIPNSGKQANLYKALEKTLIKATKDAQEKYTEANLGFDVTEAQFVPDAAMEEELTRLYGKIDEEIEKIVNLTSVALAKGSVEGGAPASAIDGVLSAGGAEEVKQIETDVDVADDLEDDLDFSLDD